MTWLDAYALVAFLADEPAAEGVEALLRGGRCRASVVNVAEVGYVSARAHELDLGEIRHEVELLAETAGLDLVVPSAADAWRAAHLRHAHYRRVTCEISLADCFLLAAAGPGDEIATADPALATVARAEGLAVVALPDRAGRRP